MLGEVLVRSGFEDDVDRALAAVGADSRVGGKYMKYGFGYGGPCLPRDNRAYAAYAAKVGLEYPLGTITDHFNQQHTEFLVEYFIAKNNRGLPFYISSVTYKPHTDIVEESQQLAMAMRLLQQGHRVYIEPSNLLPDPTRRSIESQGGIFLSRIELRHNNVNVYDIDL
jgi:UDP-glucose 6-dehydrogenase